MSLLHFYERLKIKPKVGDEIRTPKGCTRTVHAIDLRKETITSSCDAQHPCESKCDLSSATLFRNGRAVE
jgi:hypothetical protein